MAITADRTAEYRQLPASEIVEKATIPTPPFTPLDDREPPAHLFRELAPMRPTTGDPVARRIAFLLSLHPEMDREYEGIDLRHMRPADRRGMLNEIERRLSTVLSN